SNITNAMTHNTNTATEIEYAFQITNTASASDYCFRVTNNDIDLANYDHVAKVTVVHPPFISNLSLNNGQDITLVEGTTTTIYASSTVTDFNGYADMVLGTSTIYRSGVAGGADCTADNNNCYQVPASACSFTNCSGNSCTLQCR